MSVNEQHLKQSVQQAIKGVLIDSKYHDEPITFGQAVVTHYFLQQLAPKHEPFIPTPVTPSQHLNNLTRSTSAHQASVDAGQVVQFDLIKQDRKFCLFNWLVPEFKPQFGRKRNKFEDEATCVKDVFKWDDGYHDSFKNLKMKELQRSPTKWQSE